MTDQEKDLPPVAAADNTSKQAAAPVDDVAIAEASGSSEAPAAALAIGRPPIARILGAVLAVIVVAMLWIIAGNVKLQACVAQAEAQYGSNTDPKSLATLGRKNAVLRCSNSPF